MTILGSGVLSANGKFRPSWSIVFNQLCSELAESGLDLTRLSLGEAFFRQPALLDLKVDWGKGSHYSDSSGVNLLRQKFAKYYSSAFKAEIDSDNVIVSAGSKALIYLILKSRGLGSEDEVLCPEPVWLSYPEQIQSANAQMKTIPLEDSLNIERWKNYLNKNTKGILLSHPNNPQGYCYTREEVSAIKAIAKENSLFIIADEVYGEFSKKGQFVSFADGTDFEKESIYIVASISKMFSLSGWRIGFACAPKSQKEKVLTLNQHLITCAPTVLQQIVAENFETLLKNSRTEIARLLSRIYEIDKFAEKLNLNFLKYNSTFYRFLDLDGIGDSDLKFSLRLMTEQNISVVPGSAYLTTPRKFIRLSYGVEEPEKIKNALKLISQQMGTKSSSLNIHRLPKKWTRFFEKF